MANHILLELLLTSACFPVFAFILAFINWAAIFIIFLPGSRFLHLFHFAQSVFEYFFDTCEAKSRQSQEEWQGEEVNERPETSFMERSCESADRKGLEHHGKASRGYLDLSSTSALKFEWNRRDTFVCILRCKSTICVSIKDQRCYLHPNDGESHCYENENRHGKVKRTFMWRRFLGQNARLSFVIVHRKVSDLEWFDLDLPNFFVDIHTDLVYSHTRYNISWCFQLDASWISILCLNCQSRASGRVVQAAQFIKGARKKPQ